MCVVLATLVFALAGIGTPLLGLSVFADTGSLARYSGYRDVLAGVEVQTEHQRDIVDVVLPDSMLFRESIRQGEFAAWNPYSMGGEALASTPNLALGSPLSLPYWFLPTWLAPAYIKLLELICAIGGTYLFLRRLRLRRSAAWLGGLVFASSAFMVVWTNWPQTRVAALIPALFWSVECLLQRVRVREVALVSLPVAGMLLGGFPAVTGYALLTAGCYAAVRAIAEHRAWRPVAARLGAAAGGVAIGVGLAAWQLVPWIRLMGTVHIEGRTQDLTQYIPTEALLTAIAPYAYGTASNSQLPLWFGGLELIDAESYVGAAALVLAITAVALARTSRAMLPRGVWGLLVGASALWTIVMYAGGPLLWVLQHTSFLFSDNFVGRARSVLGFLVAVLAAVGFEALLRRRRSPAVAPNGPLWKRPIAYGVGVWSAVVLAGLGLYIAGRVVAADKSGGRPTGAPDYVGFLDAQVAIGVSIVLVAGACVAWLWWGSRSVDRRWRWLRPAVAGLLPLLIAGQALAWVQSYYPRTPRENFYPTNPTQTYLAEHLGHQRYYGADGAIFGSVDVTARLRALHGHTFLNERYAELVDTLPGKQFTVPATAIISDAAGGAAATSAALDRAAVSYYTAPPTVPPFGPVRTQTGDGPPITIRPGQSVTVPLPVTGPVRGVGVIPAPVGDTAPSQPHIVVTLRDAKGRVITTSERKGDDFEAGSPWIVPLAAERVRAGARLTAQISVLGTTAVSVLSHAGRPALSVVSSTDDGLRLVYAKETVIYERTKALERARWASTAQVVPDGQERVRLLAQGQVGPDTVVLDAPGPVADGKPATVTWVDDGLDEMVLTVNAQGAGYLVLADAIQNGWKVTVDGVDAPLVAADHAFAAVAVGTGPHTVRFFYPGPFTGLGAAITGLTVIGLLAALGVERWRRRRHPAT